MLNHSSCTVQVAWLTPVEIFKPWYGYALAKYILEYHRHVLQEASPLTIYEVGGGTGTLATCVLVSLQHAGLRQPQQHVWHVAAHCAPLCDMPAAVVPCRAQCRAHHVCAVMLAR